MNLDVEVQSRILQIVVNPKEYIAEVYTYDKQLLASLTLGEGRQRFDVAVEDSPSKDSGALKIMQNRIMQLEQRTQQAEQRTQQAEQEKEHLERQMEHMRNDMKH